jgi:transcriptional regulator with XRE-family HTH domain
MVVVPISTFGSRLAWLREVTGIGGRELARLIPELSKNYASETEKRGDVSPTRDKGKALCRFFGVKYTWLVLGEGPSPSTNVVRVHVAKERAIRNSEKAA